MLRMLRAVVVCVLVCAAARAATISVGPSGSGAAYTTIQAGINAANNGDTVLVAPGTYYENIDFKGKAITVTSSGGVASTIIDGGAIVGSATVIFQSGESRSSVLSGFTIQNGGHAPLGDGPTGGVYIYGSAAPTIANNIITANGCYGIVVGGGALIENNEVSGSIAGSEIGCSDAGDGIMVGANGASIIGNTIENNLSGTGIDGSGVNLLIQGNIIRNNTGGAGGGINIGNTNNISILQNLIYGNSVSTILGASGSAGGISILVPYTSVGPFTGVIAGNTITGNSAAYTGSSIATQVEISGNVSQFLVVNNIIVGSSTTNPAMSCDSSWVYLAPTPLVFDHNDIYNPNGPSYGGAYPDQTGSYGNISVDPLFVNAAANDYQLNAGSPAIDAGNNSAPLMLSTDFLGNARIVDATAKTYPIVDMGAYEFAGAQDATPTTLTLTPSEYFTTSTPATPPPALTFTVTLASAAGKPTGPVAIYEDGTLLGMVPVGSSGTATFSGGHLVSGLHGFVATYAGASAVPGSSPYFPPAVSVKFYLLVPGSSTTLALTSTPNPSSYGQAVTFAVSAYGANGTVPTPITLTDQTTSTVLTSTLAPDASGAVNYATSALSLGTHNIVASFAGSGTQSASQAAVTQTVNPVTSTTNLAVTAGGVAVSSVNAQTVVTLTATVTLSGLPVTTGQVKFCESSVTRCTDIHLLGVAQITAAGTATIKLVPGPGSHTYEAVFLGTGSVPGSTSAPETLTVGSPGSVASAVAISATGTPGDYTLTATVFGSSGTLRPTGMVSFLDMTNANYVLGTGMLSLSGTGLGFVNSSSPAVGSNPWEIATADFNGDGKPDIAVMNLVSNSVTIWLGNGDGTFTAAPTLALGNHPQGMAVADFNGDGKPDLAVSVTGSNTISIFLGNGDGTFTAAPTIAATFGVENMVAADFNGDGIVDLAMDDGADQQVRVFLGNGDGTFRAVATSSTTIKDARTMAVGDFNGDGIPDLITASEDGPSITVLLGNGDGTFHTGTPQTFAAFGGYYELRAGDFNGDGKLDLVASTIYGSSSGGEIVGILLGNGDGTFTAGYSTAAYASSASSAGLAIGDFNGDGVADVVVSASSNGVGEVMVGKGDGTFTIVPIWLTASTPFTQVAVADFNGDGLSDIALESSGTTNIPVLLTGTGVTATLNNVSIVGTGTHYVDASYAGDGSFPAATSATIPLMAEPVVTTAVLAASSTNIGAGQNVTLTVTITPDTAQDHDAGGTVTFYSNGTQLGSAVALAGDVANLSTTSLTVAGADTITCVYSGDTNFATSSCVPLTVTVNAALPSVTILTSSLNPSLYGQSVTFTAQVTSTTSGGGTPVGSVVFAYGPTVLGTVAVDPATGMASVSTSTLPLGSDTITATYQPSNAFTASSATLAQTVQESQTLVFPQPAAPAYMGTSVLLGATASSGLPVTYSVVSGPATVSGAVLTYTGVGSVVVEADQAGNASYATAPAVQQAVTTTLLSEPVATSSGPVTTVVTFSSAGMLGSAEVFTQGATGLDFAQVAGGSCAVGATYAVGQSCTVEFSFIPTRPGQRYGGIVLSTSAGAMLANSYIYGVGVGPQIGWLPGTQTTLGSSLAKPSGVAVDGSGNVFVSEYGGGLAEIAVGGAQRTIGSFGVTDDVAVDGSGNLFVIDNTSVYEVMAMNGAIPASPAIVTLATGFSQLNGIAVDATGNVFIANGTGTAPDGAVYELEAVNGKVPASPAKRMLGSGFGWVTGVAVDANGDVFASDAGNRAVYEIEAVNGGVGASPVIRALGGVFANPSNVGLDAANDVYVTDESTGVISEFMTVNGSVPANPVIRTVGTGILEPQGMVVDSNGNIFIADQAIAQVVKLDYADPPSLMFATTAVGSVSSDSPQTVTMSNDGNAPLVFTVPASGTNASITTGFTIGSGSTCPLVTTATTTPPQLSTGASCTEAISFAPLVIGVDSGKMVVTDSAVSLAQTVLLNGTGTTPTTTVLHSSLNPAGVGVTVTFTAQVTSPAGTPTGSVTFTDGSTVLGTGTLTGGVAMFSTNSLVIGTHTITATYTGASDFESSSATLTQTAGYQSVTTTSVSPEPSTYGQPTVFSVHVAGAVGSTGTPSGTVQLVFCHGATINVTLDASGNGTAVTPTGNEISEPVGSCSYTANYQGDAYFFPSASASTPYVVTPSNSTTTVSGAPNPGYLGQVVTLSAQVAGVPSPTLGPGGVPLPPGAVVATGTVQFYDGTTAIGGAVTINAAGQASVTTSTLALGLHTITAKYSGDTNLNGSTSPGVVETIMLVPTSTTLIVAPNPGTQNLPVTMGVSVAALAGVAAPYGSVTIYDGTTVLTTLTLPGASGTVASVSFTTSKLAAGTHSLTAVYTPTCAAVICALTGFTGSQSSVVILVIQPQDFTISANPPSITIETEHHKSMQLALTSIGGFTAPVSLSCAGTIPMWVTCEFSPQTVQLQGASASVPATLTIDTDALLNYKSDARGVGLGGRVILAGLLPVMLLGFVRRRRGLRGLAMIAVASMMAMAMTACSGQYPAHTEPGTYTITVQAVGTTVGASSPTVHTLDVTLVVTP
jgi:parallel beta-helix repeat protein